MNEENVTDVTRNDGLAELKVIVDLLVWLLGIYMITHPDTFDKLGDIARQQWRRFIHTLSIWTARQDIRSLPETEEN
jgi:hypothetical protein